MSSNSSLDPDSKADHNELLFAAFEPLEPSEIAPRRRQRLAKLVFGLIGLAGLITLVLHLGEIGAVLAQAGDAKPSWLILAVGAQIFAFFFQALVWWFVLRRLENPRPLTGLFSLSIGKLFADQALPSAGISGAFFITLALTNRGVQRDNAFVAFLFGGVSFILAFLIAVVISFAYLFIEMRNREALSLVTNGAATYFPVLLAFVAIIVFALFRLPQSRAWLARRAAVLKLAALAGPTIARIRAEKSLFFRSVILQLVARFFDGVTLWLSFRAIAGTASIETCLVGVNIGALAATIAPTPMGIGSFEAGLVATLSTLGTPIETALTTTLLYRGLTLWMPIAVGFFIVQRELLRKRKTPPPTATAPADRNI